MAEGASYCGSCGHFEYTDPEEEDNAPKEGSIIGAYKILSLIGEGGMGLVYLAEHMLLSRKVALKMVKSEVAHIPGLVERFFAEARAVNQIDHEHIVEITDFVQERKGDNYYIMEYLRGEDLSELMERDDFLPVAQVIGIAEQVADAMSAVHKAKIIHRDLKPENVFLTERSGKKHFVKLLDFGIAKLADDVDMPKEAKHKTSVGAVLGTPEYMSPEQASGKKVSHLTDVYALGVIMYRMVAGRVPFLAESFGELLMMQMVQAPPEILEFRSGEVALPQGLNDLIMRCLAKDKAERPQTMLEIRQELLALGGECTSEIERFRTDPSDYQGETIVPAETSEVDPAAATKKPPILFFGAGAVAVVAVLAVVFTRGGSSDKPKPETAVVLPADANVAAVAVQPVVPDARVVVTAPVDAGTPDAELPPDAAVVRKPTVKVPPKDRGFGTAAIDTRPYTTVYHGRKRLGDTPLRIKLPVGRVTLTLVNREAGIRETLTIKVKKDQTVVKKLKL